MYKTTLDELVKASTAEAQAVSAVWEAAKAASIGSQEDGSSEENDLKVQDNAELDSSDDLPDVRLHPRAVCVSFFLFFLNLFIQYMVVHCELIFYYRL